MHRCFAPLILLFGLIADAAIAQNMSSLQWSSAGPIKGKHCVQWLETADPHTWRDNYLCTDRNYGFR